MQKQQTLKDKFSFSGKGLHTGLMLTVTFNPAPVGYGFKIQRKDLEGEPIIDLIAEHVIDTSRGTVVGVGEARCSTIEHAMAALGALGIDNCHIEVDGPEFPILDGSAKFYVQEIHRVGIVEQDAERDVYVIKERIEYEDPTTGSKIVALPSETFSIESTISFDSQILNSQTAVLNSVSDFEDEIASARTFVFVREVEPLLSAGLIKGGDLDNAVVIYEKQVTQDRLDALADMLGVDHHDASVLGYIQKRPLTWQNEPARHKLLDIIGDLMLLGRRIRGRIIAFRPGHGVNNKFARLVRQKMD